MSRDFKASQVLTNKIIGSGSLPASQPSLLIYSASQSSDTSGGIPATMLASVGKDVWLLVSGSSGAAKTTTRGAVLFAGDIVVSGSIYGNQRTTFDAEIVSDQDIILKLDNDNNGNAYVQIQDSLGNNHFYFSELGESWFNYQKSANGDFQVRGSTDNALIFADAGQNAVALGATLDASPTWQDFVESDVGDDVKIILSGSRNGKGGSVRNTTLNAGDFVSSGSMYVMSDSKLFFRDNQASLESTASGKLKVVTGNSTNESFKVDSAGGIQLDYNDAAYGVQIQHNNQEVLKIRSQQSNPVVRIMQDGKDLSFTQFDSVEMLRLTDTKKVLILSGGAPTSPHENQYRDTNFFVSGSIGSRGVDDGATSLFGGDLVVSGANYVLGGSYFGNILPLADDTYDLGSASAAWQDLFLEGDITLTDAGSISTSAGDLTITANAGSNDIIVTGDLVPAADDTYDLGTTAAAWQDLHLEGDVLMTDAGKIATSAGDLTLDANSGGNDVVVTGDLVPAADDTYDLGTSGAAWQDLFLEGDITLTDAGSIATSAGDLTITANAGSNDVVVTGDLIPAADDTYDLGTTTAAWQDLHLEGNVLMTDAGSIETAAGDLTIKTTQSGASKVILSGSSADDSVLVQSDMQVDGNLYAKDAVVLELGKKINLNGAGSGEFITCPRVGSLRIDANNHAYITSNATLQFDIQNQLILSASLMETVINQGGAAFDFRVESNNLQGAILIDGGTDQVILGTNKTNAAGESLGTDVNILMSGSIGSKGTATKGTSVFSGDAVISGSLDVNTVAITTDGKVGIGTSNPSYKLEVGGNAAFGEYLYHRGDTDTFIQFANDAIGITAGGEQLITVTEAGQDIVKIGDGGDVDFQVRTNGDDNTLYVRGDTDRVGIGTNAPVSVLHIKELSPTVSIQRENNSNDSTIAFLGASGFTGAIMHLSSSNDLVFKTHDGSSPQEIMRLGGHYASDVRQVIMLSGSDMHPGAMHPKNTPDINFFVSGSVGSKQMSQRGTAVLGGDAVVSGTLHIEQSIRDQSTKIKFADGSKTYLNVPGSNVFDISGDITRIGPDMSEVSMYMPADACLFVSGAIGARGGANRKIAVFGGDVLVSGSFRAKKLYKKSLGWHVSINSDVPRFPGSYNDGMGGSATSGDVEAFFTTFGSGSLKALDLWVSENSTATCNIGFYKNSVDTPSAHCSGSFVSNNQILGLGGRGHLYVDFESAGLVSGSVNFNPGDMLTITIAKGAGSTFTKVNGTLIYEMDEDKLETNLLAGSLI